MSDLHISIALTVIFSILVIYVLARLLYHPLRWFFRLLVHVAGGLIILVIFNFLASFWGISIGVNLVTGLLVGLMGVPGLVLLVCLQLIL
ncbi:MAG: SigmaK-factor processing regulatory BofA [Firmicutes bacterium]|jgi:inhibitor of the pro-sigma K processing machinery|nr:SigmaK-factor processing regulatory BofA [Bacillota bacterium]